VQHITRIQYNINAKHASGYAKKTQINKIDQEVFKVQTEAV
jgi:hypothetical protein